MKTTTKLFMVLLVVAGMFTFASCRKLPETVFVSGQVTFEDGQPVEGVGVGVKESTLMTPIIPVVSAITDENGYYELEFNPKEDLTYQIKCETTKDDHHYIYRGHVDKYKAHQEINIILKIDE